MRQLRLQLFRDELSSRFFAAILQCDIVHSFINVVAFVYSKASLDVFVALADGYYHRIYRNIHPTWTGTLATYTQELLQGVYGRSHYNVKSLKSNPGRTNWNNVKSSAPDGKGLKEPIENSRIDIQTFYQMVTYLYFL